jgi:hypothetical protein
VTRRTVQQQNTRSDAKTWIYLHFLPHGKLSIPLWPNQTNFWPEKTRQLSNDQFILADPPQNGCAMKDELANQFPKLTLQGEWIIASPKDH